MSKYCNVCGTPLTDDLKFCRECGAPVDPAPVQPVPPTPSAQPVYAQPAQPVYAQPSPQYTEAPPQRTQTAHKAYNNDAPQSVGGFVGQLIVMGIPLVGFILTIVWACNTKVNRNKKNLACAMLIMYAIAIGLTILLVLLAGAGLAALFNGISGGFNAYDLF